jgi:hypothetical protein
MVMILYVLLLNTHDRLQHYVNVGKVVVGFNLASEIGFTVSLLRAILTTGPTVFQFIKGINEDTIPTFFMGKEHA